jgi:hypothetical protein
MIVLVVMLAEQVLIQRVQVKPEPPKGRTWWYNCAPPVRVVITTDAEGKPTVEVVPDTPKPVVTAPAVPARFSLPSF